MFPCEIGSRNWRALALESGGFGDAVKNIGCGS